MWHCTHIALLSHPHHAAGVRPTASRAIRDPHGASVGPFIFLVQAEILAAASRLTVGDAEAGYHQVPDADRRRIAEIWLAHFNHPGTHR